MKISCKKNKSNLCVRLSFSGISLYLGLFCGTAGCFITLGLRGQGFNCNGGFRFIILGRPAARGLGGRNTPQLIGGLGAEFFPK